MRGHRLPRLERDQQRRREPRARQDRLRLRLLEQHRRLRHQPDADRLFHAPRPTAARSGSACSTRCWSRRSASCFATILGFLVGIARLSKNWLVARIAGCYVELIRNLPLLLQLLFWYNAVLKALPDLRDSCRRSRAASSSTIAALFLPQPIFQAGLRARRSIALARRHRRRDRLPHLGAGAGRAHRPAGAGALGHARAGRSALPLAVFALSGFPVDVRLSRDGPLQHPRRHRDPAGVRGAAVRARRSTPRPSSPRWCAPASWRCRRGQTEAAYALGPAARADAAAGGRSRRRCA